MRNDWIYILIFLFGVFISSCSQILLKKSANKDHSSIVTEYLNFRVIIAYGMFFLATLLNTIAFKVMPLSLAPVLESTGYLYVTIFSYFFLKEKISRKKYIGIITIIIGVLLFTI